MTDQTDNGNQDKLAAWAIVEIFGHTQISGYVSEYSFGGSAFVRIDVPAVDGVPAFTKLYGQGAIYSITFTDELTARRAVASIRPRPITIFLGTPKPEFGRTLLNGGDEDDNTAVPF